MNVLQRKKGSVLVFSLLVLAIVLSSALSIAVVNVSNRKSAASTAQSVQSFQVADTAAEKVMKAVYNGNYPSLYRLYHDGLGSMACGEGSAIITAPGALILNNIVSTGVGSATVSFLDTSGAKLADCTATNWRDTLASVKVEGSANGTVRVIEAGIAPLSSMAWGKNGSGQLGDGSLIGRSSPVSTIGGSKWKSVSAAGVSAGAHVLAVKEDGTLWAWGANDSGQLGNNEHGSGYHKTSPIQIGTDNTWESVSAGESHSLAIKMDHSMWAWGNGADRRLGTGNASDRDVPVRIAYDNSGSGDCVNNCPAGWKAVSAGSDFSLAIGTDDSLWSWGNNNGGRLGHAENGHKPAQVTGSWKFVSAGENHVLAIGTDDFLYAWGPKEFGQLGDGTSFGSAQSTPLKIGSAKWISVSAGYNHSLGIQSDSTLWSWGRNAHGQLGNGSVGGTDVLSPEQRDGGSTGWTSVSAGPTAHSLALKTNGTNHELWSWGDNDDGQVGDGTSSDRGTLYRVPGNWKLVDGGSYFSIGVRE